MPNLEFLFRFMQREHGARYLMKQLRQHYGDICSNSDIILHKILNMLEAGESLDTIEDEHDSLKNHILATLISWREEGRCKPDIWHAS
jgi:hypothetical protein